MFTSSLIYLLHAYVLSQYYVLLLLPAGWNELFVTGCADVKVTAVYVLVRVMDQFSLLLADRWLDSVGRVKLRCRKGNGSLRTRAE